MELTLESAFSAGGFVGHLSYLLIVVSMLMRSMIPLRLLMIASSLVGIAYDAIWLMNPVGIFWETMLVVVNLWQLGAIWYQNVRGQFSAEDLLLVQDRLAIPDAVTRRKLLDSGIWCDEPVGAQLTREGETPSHLVYLAAGRVAIESDGGQIAECTAGDFVGEMSLFHPEHRASASAVVTDPLRCWKISHERIRHMRRNQPDLAAAIDGGLARDMRRKIDAGNAARLAGRS